MRTSSLLLAMLALIGGWAIAEHAAASPSFNGLGFLPGENYYSLGNGVSGDGAVAVGTAGTVNHPPPGSSNINRAFRWTSAGGMVDLGPLPGGSNTYANGVSGDGSVVVGCGDVIGPYQHAFRWTTEGGTIDLGTLTGGTSSISTGVSSDGAVVVGYSSTSSANRAFRWTGEGGMVDLGHLPGGGSTYANGVSRDGSVVVGYGGIVGPDQHAFRWTNGEGIVDLGTVPGDTNSYATAASDDGSVVVGLSGFYSGIYGPDLRAFRWTLEGGMVSLGTLPGGANSYATAISGDGSTVVGYGDAAGSEHAFLWNSALGMVDLDSYLPTFGIDLTGWTLEHAIGVSIDGQTLVGYGTHDGFTEAWVATIPEPSTALLLTTASLFVLRRRPLK